METEVSVIDYCEVRCAADYFCTVENGNQRNLISRSKVDRVFLDYGFQATRPIIQVVVGVALLGFLGWPIYRVWFSSRYGGSVWGAEAYLAVFSLIGGWMIYNAFKKGWFLRLETKHGIDKLPFGRLAHPEGIKKFVRRVQDEAGITIEMAPRVVDHAGLIQR